MEKGIYPATSSVIPDNKADHFISDEANLKTLVVAHPSALVRALARSLLAKKKVDEEITIPKGYKLVPLGPDDVMIDAAHDSLGEAYDDAPITRACQAYVAASPPLPTGWREDK